MEKILLVSSPGGHFVQLSLISKSITTHERVVLGCYKSKPDFIECERYYTIHDFSRTDAYKVFLVFFECLYILIKEKPKRIISTGAAPGLVFCIVGKILKFKCLWVDSIANSKKLSMSGRIAKAFGVNVLSQWENVAKKENVLFRGRVL